MSKFKLFLLLAVTALIQTSCEEELEPASIDYYITITDSEKYNHLDFDFLHTRAFQTIDGENAIRSVYLDPQSLSLRNTGSQIPSYLGRSEIEKSLLTGYDFSFANASVEMDGQIVELDDSGISDKTKAETFLKIYDGDLLSVIFTIDIDKSIIQEVNNTDTSYVFAPLISISID